jgi:hypothetical protein
MGLGLSGLEGPEFEYEMRELPRAGCAVER